MVLPKAPPRSYVICTTPRSGSTLLCKMLAATGCAGNPGSHFHVPSLERWLAVYGLDDRPFGSRQEALAAVFQAAIARGMADSDVFGLRLQRKSFDFFMEQLAVLAPGEMADVDQIEQVFGKTTFVHLSRTDRLDQAISLLRAEQSGLWHRNSDGSEMERTGPPTPPTYDAAAIARHMSELAAFDADWAQWFAQQEIAPLSITYDEVSKDPRGVLARVLSAIGCDPQAADAVGPQTAKLADAESLRWKQRFLRERA